MNTIYDIEVEDKLIGNYMTALIGQFYKILPIKESGEPSLYKYMESLERELIGCRTLISALEYDSLYLELLAILQFLISNDTTVEVTRGEVFKAISTIKKLQQKYCGTGVRP